jgi:hypothetical protein
LDHTGTVTTENVYCGVVLVNAVLGGLNILFATWLAHDRRRADSHRRADHLNSMLQFEQVLEKLKECPLVHMDQDEP